MLTDTSILDSPKQRPLSTFIKKLWFVLTDKNYEEFIFWVNDGQVICIPNAATFSQAILPKLFKHNNWQSFVRQLNLYGFRKVYQLNLSNDDSLDKKNVWHFKHLSFQKNRPEQLFDIRRGVSKPDQEPVQIEFKKETTDSKHQSTDSKNSFEDELLHMKQRLLEVDTRNQDLFQQVFYLNKIQSNQNTAIKMLTTTLQHILINNPDCAVEGTLFTEILEGLSQANEVNGSGDDNFLKTEYTPTSVLQCTSSKSTFESKILSQQHDELRGSSIQKQLPPIRSLFHTRPSETLPPIKKHKYMKDIIN